MKRSLAAFFSFLWLALGASLAFGQTPTLVQMVASTANPQGVGETGNTYKFVLPNAVGASNCLVLAIAYPSGSTPTVTDNNSNTWPSTPNQSADGGSGGYVLGVFIVAGANAGVTTVTVTFGAAVIPFQYTLQEWNNIATSSPLNGSQETNNADPTTASALSTGSFTPGANTGGNLLLSFFAPNGSLSGAGVLTSYTAGSSFTLLHGDNGWISGQGFSSASQYFIQTTPAAINPSATATGITTTNSFNAVAIALKVASAGTAPGSGIRIVKILHFTNSGNNPTTSGSTYKLQIPATGNLRVLVSNQEQAAAGINITGIVDSDSNTFTTKIFDGTSPQLWYAANTSADSTAIATLTFGTSSNIPMSWQFIDITGAATSPFDVMAGVTQTSQNSVTSLTNYPTISPTTANGLVIGSIDIATGPGLAVTAPSGSVFGYVTYNGESDLSLMDNADGLANYYNAASGAIHFGWTITSVNPNNVSALAVAFKAPATGASCGPLALLGVGC